MTRKRKQKIKIKFKTIAYFEEEGKENKKSNEIQNNSIFRRIGEMNGFFC